MFRMEAGVEGKRYPSPVCQETTTNVFVAMFIEITCSDGCTYYTGFELNHNWTIPKVNGKNSLILKGSNPTWPWPPPFGTHRVLVREGGCIIIRPVTQSNYQSGLGPGTNSCPFMSFCERPKVILSSTAAIHWWIWFHPSTARWALRQENKMRHYNILELPVLSLVPIYCLLNPTPEQGSSNHSLTTVIRHARPIELWNSPHTEVVRGTIERAILCIQKVWRVSFFNLSKPKTQDQ